MRQGLKRVWKLPLRLARYAVSLSILEQLLAWRGSARHHPDHPYRGARPRRRPHRRRPRRPRPDATRRDPHSGRDVHRARPGPRPRLPPRRPRRPGPGGHDDRPAGGEHPRRLCLLQRHRRLHGRPRSPSGIRRPLDRQRASHPPALARPGRGTPPSPRHDAGHGADLRCVCSVRETRARDRLGAGHRGAATNPRGMPSRPSSAVRRRVL